MSSSFTFSSNAVRLSGRAWVAVAVLFVATITALPKLWSRGERWDRPADYRLPYELSDDYWSFARWCEDASSRFPIAVVGDSVVWGQYVERGQTLTHYLNEALGADLCANLGVDGVLPAAIAGLLRYHGKALKNKRVILHVNPLWMSSPKHDLTTSEEFRFNHPRLVPQFIGKPKCYHPELGERVAAVAERGLGVFSLLHHVRSVHFTNLDLHSWTLRDPYANPVRAISTAMPVPDELPRSAPIPWTESGTPGEQEMSWLNVGDSYQWKSTVETLMLLQKRGNSDFAIVGPFNTHLLTSESAARYEALKEEVAKRLEDLGVDCWLPPELPSEEYADASHPLAAGYRRMARDLCDTSSFKEWMTEVKGDALSDD